MLKIIPLLTDPARHGGDAGDAFDVVVPSLPGYGFSDRPRHKGMTVARMADLFVRLMRDELGCARFAVRGSDLGASVALHLARKYPDTLVGLHLSGTNPPAGAVPR